MTKFYKKDYPRPQFVRNDYIILNGTWEFIFDPLDEGEKKGWNKGFNSECTIEVPYTYESKKSGVGNTRSCRSVWYMKQCSFGKEHGEVVDLIFEGVDYEATVWVNGEFVGEHEGAYSRFQFDIADKLDTNGDGLIVVRVRDSFSTEIMRGKQRWFEDNYDCWYTQNTGIWKSVWAEELSKTHINKVKMTPEFDKSSLELEIDIVNPDNIEVDFEVMISFSGRTIYKGKNTIKSETYFKSIDLRSESIKWEIELWTPEHPHLYDIEFTLRKNDTNEKLDFVGSYFGMRKISVLGNQVCLNNQPIYQRMILDQGYWKESLLTPPDEESIYEDLKKIQEFGFNGVRKHQKIEDERFYYLADVMGIFVWCEAPSTYKYSTKAVLNFQKEWLDILEQNYNHPSIITWVPFNESWGISKVFMSKSQQFFTKGIYYLTKALDPHRLVISNDGWEHTKSDIITIHDYSQNKVEFEQNMNKIFELSKENISINNSKFLFAEGNRYEGQPIIISEFGGIAYGGSDGWGYGDGAADEKEYLERLNNLIKIIEKNENICGFCYTQLTDVEQEVNGLQKMNHEDKISPENIKDIVSGKR